MSEVFYTIFWDQDQDGDGMWGELHNVRHRGVAEALRIAHGFVGSFPSQWQIDGDAEAIRSLPAKKPDRFVRSATTSRGLVFGMVEAAGEDFY